MQCISLKSHTQRLIGNVALDSACGGAQLGVAVWLKHIGPALHTQFKCGTGRETAQSEPIRLPLCFSKMGWGRSPRSARSSKDSAVLEDGLRGPQTGWNAMSTEYLAVAP